MKHKPHDCRHLRSADYDEVTAVYAAGRSLTQTAECCGVSVGVVRNALKRTGTTLRARGTNVGKRRTYGQTRGRPLLAKRTFDYASAQRMYESGSSLSQVAAEFGTSTEAVRKAMHSIGVKLRRRGTHPGRSHNRIKGGKALTPQGYVRKRKDFQGDVRGLEHRLIAERALHRKLRPGEVVHHINCERADNRPENLLICSVNYHVALHARMRALPYWSKF